MKKLFSLLLPVFLLTALTAQSKFKNIHPFGEASALTPVITVTGTLAPFANCSGNPSTEQNFIVSGTSLTDNLVVTAPAGFELSTRSGDGFAGSVSLTPSAGTVINTTIYVRMSPIPFGNPSGNIACSSTGATTQNIGVKGIVNPIPDVKYFGVESIGVFNYNRISPP